MDRFNRRAFEHRVFTPNEETTDSSDSPDSSDSSAGGERTRKFYYERLMQVSISHSYYNATRDACPDFNIQPTLTTASLMSDLGLLYKYDGSGFSVLYDVTSPAKDVLLNYLARQRKDDPKGECWARLSFVLALNNPYFVNFTDIPIDVNPVEENFYFTNQTARLDKRGKALLNPDGRFDDDLLHVVSTQVQIRLKRETEAVLVRDLSNEVVIKPQCCPPTQNPPSGGGDDVCVVYLDLSALAEDKYEIQIVKGLNCEDAKHSQDVVRQWSVLYTRPFPVPLCFIDLLFTDPQGDGRGVYPVRYPASGSKGVIVPIHYELKFHARATYWNYFVVPQPQTETFEGLRIESVSEPPVEFAGPCCVTLPNGSFAYRFCSTESLRLRQQSEYSFRLYGLHGLMTHEAVLVNRLPVASSKQVIPLSTEAACAALSERLCEGVTPAPPCLELIDFVCPPDGKGSGPPGRNYSDIYVYV